MRLKGVLHLAEEILGWAVLESSAGVEDIALGVALGAESEEDGVVRPSVLLAVEVSEYGTNDTIHL